MFEKLSEISKILLIPALVLYILGFVSVNAHLAQFGMVTFDILSARFLIAGFYSLLSLMIVFVAAWELHSRLPLSKIFKTENWKKRIFFYISYPGLLSMVSLTITSVLTLGAGIVARDGKDFLTFKPILGHFLRGYDYIGNLLANFNPTFLDKYPSIIFILKATLYAFSYLFVIIVILASILFLTKQFLPWKKKSEAKEEGVQEAATSTEKPIREYGPISSFAILCIDVLCLCFFISMFLYSAVKVGGSVFGFESLLAENLKLNNNLFFAWVYSSALGIYFFLSGVRFPAQLSFTEINWTDLVKRFFDLSSIQNAIQQLFLPILVALYLFGAVIFPRIPFTIGGGEPRSVLVKTNTQIEKVFLLEESSQYLFLVKFDNGTSTAIQLNREKVEFIQTKERIASTTPAIPTLDISTTTPNIEISTTTPTTTENLKD